MTRMHRGFGFFLAVAGTIGCGYSKSEWEAKQAELDRVKDSAKQVDLELQKTRAERDQLAQALKEAKEAAGKCALSGPTSCVPVQGAIGSSPQWGSAWLDVGTADFDAGSKLRFTLVQTATKIRNVLVRLLPTNGRQEEPVGVVGTYNVPQDGVVEVPLQNAHRSIKQISVHGHCKAWDYDLGCPPTNGPAKLGSVAICK